MTSSSKNKTTAQTISAKEISFPKGGGAVRGIGDSFQTTLFSGAGAYSIPVPVTPARGFEPQLSISYSSGSGNGIFGLGFSLSLSRISIYTREHAPRYNGTDKFELDGKLLVAKEDSINLPNPRSDQYEGQTFRVTEYLPRLLDSYSLIEHWQNPYNGFSFWKVISMDNTTSVYGFTSRIANPDDTNQVFEWLIDRSTDSKGNSIVYNYVAENDKNVPSNIFEVNRSITANRYISTIQYGNYSDSDNKLNFAFEIVFNYGQENLQNPQDNWAVRPDPYSSYVSGFEIRTYRLCTKIQMVHIFPDELGDPFIVKELAFTYKNSQQYNPVQFQAMSMLTSAILTGYRKELEHSQVLPAIDFGYSTFQPPLTPEFKMLSLNAGTIPGYLNPTQYLPIDLYGDGLPGFLLSNNESTFYLEPLGNGEYKSPVTDFDFPINKNIQGGQATLTDIDGDGQLELVVNSRNSAGFYKQTFEGTWNSFVPFDTYPNAMKDPSLEMVDLADNGRTDLLLADVENILYYPSSGKSGYSSAQTIPNDNDIPIDKARYQQELVTFATIFGDGVSHRVRISSGSVECWPSLGYGRFGKKVTLANAPIFTDSFDISRLFLADIDGSGTTDLAYVYPDRVEVFMNQSGNSFSSAIVIRLPELFSSLDQISFTDILGNGTACLVFTKIAPVPKHYYYNFSGEFKLPDGTVKQSLKPYLLNSIDANLGAVSYINYCSSTKFALEDKLAGRPWVTKLPFPVQVVEELIQYDKISQSKYTSKYKYHDGYYDPEQRQFMGFGFIESWDSETYEEFQATYSNPDYPTTELNKELFVPPVYTKTWHLNGAPALEYEKSLKQYKNEFFKKDTDAYDFPDNQFSIDIYKSNTKTFNEAFKALASQVLRTEVYGDDQSNLSSIPYSVSQSNCEVVFIQAATEDDYAVFRVDPRETITYHYERDYADPRVEQHFNLLTDQLCGQPRQSCSLYLPRRKGQALNYPEQYVANGTITTTDFYNSPVNVYDFRLRGIKYQEQSFKLLGLSNPAANYYSFNEIKNFVINALSNPVPYNTGTPTVAGVQAEQTSWLRYYFCDTTNGMVGNVLPFKSVSPQALLHHVATAEFTNDNVTAMYGERLTVEVIEQFGGYTYDDVDTKYWMNLGLIQNYKNADGFYLPSGTQSSSTTVNAKSTIEYDFYLLSLTKTTNYLSEAPLVTNEVHAVTDYQTMSPRQQVDINGTVSQVLFDAMGQVTVTSKFGTEDGVPVGGMLLHEYNGTPAQYVVRTIAPNGSTIDFNAVLDDTNKEYFLQGASSYFYYDLNSFTESGRPASFVNLERQNYFVNPGGPTSFVCQTTVAYNDGLGRSLAKKIDAQPENPAERWLTSGRSVYNNKGKVCEAYLPYYSPTPQFETQDEITLKYKVPPPAITHYDPLLREIRKDTPKGFFSKVEFTPWEQSSYDEDDTVLDAAYYKNFVLPPDPTPQQLAEKKALQMAAQFYGTPSTNILDNMGGVIRTIQILNDAEGTRELVTFYELDIQGRKLMEIDPRLYASNLAKGTSYYNFKYLYGMGGQHPLVTDSADAGVQRHFNNIFEKAVWLLSPREYCQINYYDWLQRQTQLLVKKVPGTDPITDFASFNLVEDFTYGDAPGLPVGKNLKGQVYILKDLSGIVTSSSYSMLGNVLQTSRQMTSVYKTAINWKNPVPLDEEIHTKVYTYNAQAMVLSETTQDNSVSLNTTTNTYTLTGLLKSISLNSNGNSKNIIGQITYDSNLQRKQVTYGNGITTTNTYEATTLRLINILSQSGTAPSAKVWQNISYVYDPVGNITWISDSSIDVIFNKNQKVDPVLLYQYDSLYRLTQGQGRQHPGIAGNTYCNNIADGDFMQSKFSQTPINNAQAIEKYTENYFYDDAGNFIKKQHIAASSPWTIETPVIENCNRLQGLVYDASGNQRQLAINNVVALDYNCCENLVSASIIQRPTEADDSDYYVYDSSEQRTRKVSEQLITSSASNYADTVYFGNYETLKKGVQSSDGSRTITTNRKTLRIMDGSSCVAILYHWVAGGPAGTPTNPAPDQLRYQLDNNLGSVAVEVDDTGLLVSYEEYFPYGGTAIIAGPNQVDVALKVYRYSGKECDNSTGLYYYGMRYYVSWLGRWLKPDPAGTVDGLNLYAFVGGNPISHVDKRGLSQEKPSGEQPFMKGALHPQVNFGLQYVLREVYAKLPIFSKKDIAGYHAFALNPLSIPIALLQQRKDIDYTVQTARKVAQMQRVLKNYTETNPKNIVAKQQADNAKWNTAASASGMAKRFLLQQLLIQTFVKSRQGKIAITTFNVMSTVYGNVLLKDIQFRQALKENGITIQHLDAAKEVLKNEKVKFVAAKPIPKNPEPKGPGK